MMKNKQIVNSCIEDGFARQSNISGNSGTTIVGASNRNWQ